MSTNALLVRWYGGWRWVVDTPAGRRRRERSIDLSVSSVRAVDTIAGALLNIFNDARTEVTVEVDPKSDAERALLAYDIGDTISVQGMDGTLIQERVQSLTARWDAGVPGGHPVVVPQLRDIVLNEQEAFAQLIDRMNRGALNGATPAVGVVANYANNGEGQVEPSHIPWSVPTIAALTGAPWIPPTRVRVLRATVTTLTGTLTTCSLLRNGALWINLLSDGSLTGPATRVIQLADNLTVDQTKVITLSVDGTGTGLTIDLEYIPIPVVQ